MTAVRIAALTVCLACPAVAEDRVAPTGPEITQALTACVPGCPDGTLQDCKPGGQTLAGQGKGRWRVQGDLYCAVWPPSDRWSCPEVARSARGLDIRFTGDDRSAKAGRSVDWQ
jgi:hypothetical protein